MTSAIFYDGVTADRRIVDVETGQHRLTVRLIDASSIDVPSSELSVVEDDQHLLIVSRNGHPGWRLLVDAPVDPAIRALLPRPARYGRWIDRIGLPKATALLAGVAAAVLFVGHSAPAWIAPFVPQQWERNLGSALVGDFGDNACRDPAATRALARFASRIDPAGAGHIPIPITLIDVRIFNAAAIPGNQIIIFDGALRDTPNPDAMAGILAHEIAHVRRRHVTQALIRELGIGALIRLFAGDVGANAEQIVSLSYTRANEAEADADAQIALNRANIDPRPTAALFRMLDGKDGGFDRLEWLNSHPRSGERARAFDASFRKGRGYTPSLSAADYKAIRTACPAKRDAEKAQKEADDEK